ncbi:MAG: rhomboid family intramembrane serine protease [Pseudomonadota bacterium]
MQEDYSQPVFNALPPAVIGLAVIIFVIEVIFMVGARGYFGPEGIGWRVAAIQDYGFFNQALYFMVERGDWRIDLLSRFVTYPFVHGTFTHAIFVIVFLLALGKLVGEVFGNVAVLVLFFACGIFGALVYAGLTGPDQLLIGGFPSVYGLIGAYTFLLWVRFGALGQNQYQAFTLIGFLLGIQLIFGVLFGSNNDWIAEIAGFAFGFFLTPALVPGAFRRFLERMRQR